MRYVRVEIWMGGMKNPTYIIENPLKVEMCGNNTTVRITDNKGIMLETSPHNVVMISEPIEGTKGTEF